MARFLKNLVGGIICLILLVTLVNAATTGCPEEAYEEVVVAPGDTLWSIVRRHGVQGDPRRMIDEIRRLNSLADARLHPGQKLLLPR
ncbi:MAG: LysM peptidoglycan-binding domain-containing protein [Firmicutes bacterium]|jgi:LysM repeat protein|nr:LysM peptidoglycan-binding domain-containing protein [Bacillota bacterium]